MKLAYVMWLIALGAIAAMFYMVGCSTDSGNNANYNDCYQASDSTMVCGDTNFKVY